MKRTKAKFGSSERRWIVALVCLLAVASVAPGQSNRLESPTPATGAEIAGRISPLDLGDSRLTKHYYTFGARPGDLELTVVADNLEGDIDLFSAAGMRSLAKVTLYAGLGETGTRTIFFRRAEAIILRVQARSPNDSDGTYRIRLGGTFAPAPANALGESARTAETASTTATTPIRNGRRVNSVGARIEEPKPEVSAKPAAPAPAEAPRAKETVAPKSARNGTPSKRARAPRRESARRESSGRGAKPNATSSTNEPKTEPSSSEPTNRETSNTEAGRGEPARRASAGTTNRTRAARTRVPRVKAKETANSPVESSSPAPGNSDARAAREPASAAVAVGLEAPGSRLVLQLREGGLYVREMSDVRRVTVERGFVVVVLKSGRTERQPTTNVLRMSIEP